MQPSGRSLILKIQLNSRNEFQQLLLGPGAPLWDLPGCNVLGNVIPAIGVLIVSILYRGAGGKGLVHSVNVRTSASSVALPGKCTLVPEFLTSLKFLLFLHKSHFSSETRHFPACKSNTRIIKICPTEKMTKIHFYVDIWWVQPTTKSQSTPLQRHWTHSFMSVTFQS